MSARPALSVVLASGTALLLLAGCESDEVTEPQPEIATLSEAAAPTLAQEVRALTSGRGIGPLVRPAPVRPALVQLGQALAFDKILSGNKDISCMTCHLPRLGTGDGRSLSIGQGATGLGADRNHPLGAFIPRNAPQLFNLFAVKSLFWDGRIELDARGNLVTPAAHRVTPEIQVSFEFGGLSALPLFPVLSRSEMRADDGNELADVKDKAPQQVWRALMTRLGRVKEYRRMFEEAYPGKKFAAMNFGHASNAIAAFFIDQLAFNDSPWDRFLAGNDAAMTERQLLGAKNFMSARCSVCHNGPALTDNLFHNVAVAQLGPGEGDGGINGAPGPDDFGRMRVTGDRLDRYKFRTPALRNVELTGPYGHDGAYLDLEEFVDHYSESHLKLDGFLLGTDPARGRLELLLGNAVLLNKDDILATRDVLLEGVVFPRHPVIEDVTEFMRALTDPAALNLTHLAPGRVPSGLPVDH
ncbi:MAG: cytochrome-c peroxidase [Gemmatimonadales bacterium]